MGNSVKYREPEREENPKANQESAHGLLKTATEVQCAGRQIREISGLCLQEKGIWS